VKASAKTLYQKLKQNRVELDVNGEVDYSRCGSTNVVDSLKAKEQLVKITLMHADLEFEYPQKLEKVLVKGNILEWLD
jgi:hypothetical protein